MSLPIPPHPHIHLKFRKKRYKNRPAKAKLMMEKSSSFFTKATPMDSQKPQSSMSFSQSKPARTPIILRTVSAMLVKRHTIPTRKAILLILGCSFQLIANPPKPIPRVSSSNAHVSALRKHFITGFARCQRAICAMIQKHSPKVCIFPKILHKYRYPHPQILRLFRFFRSDFQNRLCFLYGYITT